MYKDLHTKRVTQKYEMSINSNKFQEQILNSNKFQEINLSQKMLSINHIPHMSMKHDPSEISDSASDNYTGGQEATPQMQNSTKLMKKVEAGFGWTEFYSQVKSSLFGTEETPSNSKKEKPKLTHRESIVQEIDSSEDEGINHQMIQRAIRPQRQSPGSPFRLESTEEQASVKVINYPTFQKSASIAPV